MSRSTGASRRPRSRQASRPAPAAAPAWRRRARTIAMVAWLVGLGGWVWSTSLDGVLVLDDVRAIARNPTIRTLWPLSTPLAPPTASTVAGRPVANLTFAVNYALAPADARERFSPGGPGAPPGEHDRFLRNVRGYHLLNVAIHLVAGLALFGVVRRTLLAARWGGRFAASAPWLALSVTAVWLVHPLQTGAVTYLVQRVESLAGCFYLVTLYCAIRASGSVRPIGWMAGAVAASALGMATKEVTVTAPLVVAIWDRVFGPADRRPRWGMLAALAATWAILAVLVAGEQRGPSIDVSVGASWRYLMTQAEVLAHYARLSLVPSPLVFLYTWPLAESFREVWAPFLAVAALVAVAGFGVVRRHPLGFAGAWFFLVLAPSSSLLPIVTEVAAEHRMYLPLAAVVAVAVVGAAEVGRRFWPAKRPGVGGGVPSSDAVVVAVAMALAVGAGVETRARNRDYRSDSRLWQTVVASQPENARARVAFGAALLEAGRFAEAEAELREAVRLDPADANGHVRLGAALASQGRLDEAIEPFRRTLALRPGDPDAHRSLGRLYAERGQDALAVVHLGAAVEAVGDDPRLLVPLAAILAESADQAVRDPARAVRLAARAVTATGRRDAAVLEVLSVAQAASGRWADALKTGDEALQVARGQGHRALVDRLERRVAALRATLASAPPR